MTYFTYIPGTLTLNFFREEPVEVTLPMGDAMDALLLEMAERLDSAEDYDAAAAALEPVLGQEACREVLSRIPARDTLHICQLAGYILSRYGQEKEKNLSAASQGRPFPD